MANSTKRDIVLKLRREERMAIKATRFMKKPMTIRQTKRTIAISVFCGALLFILAVLRFTVFDAAFEPFAHNIITGRPAPPTPTPVPSALSIEDLAHQASDTAGPWDHHSH